MSNEHITKRAKLKLTLHDFYKKPIEGQSSGTNSSPNIEVTSAPKSQVEVENVEKATNANDLYLERDPGLCLPICSYPVDERDNVRISYIKLGPCQPKLKVYPPIQYATQTRFFNILDLINSQGLSIQKQGTEHIAFHVIFLILLYQEMLHLLVKDFKIGRELKMEKDVHLHNMKAATMVHYIVLLLKSGRT
ncbi:hypothetical protein PTKIN_Ptkin11bG0021900 [Pterospermum kingtungense]